MQPHATPPSTPPTDAPPYRYNAALAGRIEERWQRLWEEQHVFAAPNPGETGFDAAKPKKYVLDMFPYPSGVGLHVGHPLGYIATDIYARYLRMTGHNVLHAMGFDAFGLPAEQYAVQTGQHPRITTYNNIATMKAQLRRLGLGHDPRRGVSTTDPEFYRWTQWIFLRLYGSWYDQSAGAMGKARPISELEQGLRTGAIPTRSGRPWNTLSQDEQHEEIDSRRLAYSAEVPVNWCPMLGTVLANEEVTAEGRSERGNYPVYKRPLKQWIMRITEYAPRLLADLDLVDWPEPVKLMQRNWIGKSEGALVRFAVDGPPATHGPLTVFTTRPDTLFGATYMVLSPEHPLVEKLATEDRPVAGFLRGAFPGYSEGMSCREAVVAYQSLAASRSETQRTEGKEKTGAFTGAYAVNPVNGAKIPIFIADYVLMGYGTGAIMAVPAHDERDWEFARAFGLPIVPVVQEPGARPETARCFSGEGVACNSTGPAISLDGLPTPQAKSRITQHLEAAGDGTRQTNFKLRDWLFSRQRYWGEPFPIVYDERGRPHPLPESMLPVMLPELTNFQPESSEDPNAPPRPPLARAADWTKVTLDLGDGPREYTRETNTMPNWAGSCWYYLRYLDPENDASLCSPDVESYWMRGGTPPCADAESALSPGVDLYVGGVEHAVLHLLYARFWHKVLFDLGFVSTPEPFHRLFNQGYIQAFAYKDERGVYVEASAVTLADGSPATENQDHPGPYFYQGRPVTREYGKMGKSLKNAVAPDDICSAYGCDTLRVYEMSMGPLEASKPWNTRDITGAFRFLQRIWRNLIDEQTGAPRVSHEPADRQTRRVLHKTIIGVRRDMETLGFNTAVSKLIELNNHLGSLALIPLEVARPLVLMLAPLAPHIAEELYDRVVRSQGNAPGSIAFEPFPVADESLAADDEVEIPVAFMGKPRHRIRVSPGLGAQELEAAALADAKVVELLKGKTIKKIIVVPNKMVNIVTQEPNAG
ncbi:MAG: leucine--tRNA ligase [Phycisphaeraceae bacterium]|nr:leucine--tRNA ligase [Phycisphaeraceae bacterium]